MWLGLQGNALYRQMAQSVQKILEGKKPSEMQGQMFPPRGGRSRRFS